MCSIHFLCLSRRTLHLPSDRTKWGQPSIGRQQKIRKMQRLVTELVTNLLLDAKKTKGANKSAQQLKIIGATNTKKTIATKIKHCCNSENPLKNLQHSGINRVATRLTCCNILEAGGGGWSKPSPRRRRQHIWLGRGHPTQPPPSPRSGRPHLAAMELHHTSPLCSRMLRSTKARRETRSVEKEMGFWEW